MEKTKRIHYTFMGLMIAVGLILLWRSFFGVNYNDEMYYADCLYRLYQGDVYLVHDWQIHLMSCIPVYPFYVLFQMMTGSNTGVILYLRILYVLFQLLVATVCYQKLKHLGWGSIFVSIIYLLFTPFNIAALSYNTMGLGFALLTFALLTGPKKYPVRDSVLCGVCLAFCILSNPFAIVLYFLYAAACLIQLLLRKLKKCDGWEELSFSSLFWITVGAFFIFVIFLFMLHQRASLGELKLTFSYNFRMPGYEQGPAHWKYKWVTYFEKIYQDFSYLIWISGLTVLISAFDKKRLTHALWYILPTSLAVLCYLYHFGFVQTYVPTNYCSMPLAFLGFVCFCLSPQKNLRYFFLWFLPGVLYSLCSHFASDTGILCITSSFILCSAVSGLFLYTLCQDLPAVCIGNKTKMGIAGCLLTVFAVHIAIAGYLRITFFYNEAPLNELTTQVTSGPAKGLFTTAGMAEFHSERVRGLESLSLTEEDNLLVMGMEPWAYLCTDAAVANYTCWGDFNENIYEVYQFFFPQKQPTVVYCTNYEEALQSEIIVQKYLSEGYEVVTLESATILRKPAF